MNKRIQENNVYVIKSKIYIPKEHFYACFITIVDVEKNKILKVIGVVSLDPSVFEIDIKLLWNKLEKLIYRFKLEKGVLFELTKKLYSEIYNYEEKICSIISSGHYEQWKDIVFKIIKVDDEHKEKTKIVYEIENIIKGEETERNGLGLNNHNHIRKTIENIQEENFYVKTKPVIDVKNGTIAEKLKLKKIVQCQLIDTREVVKYIIKLLYGKEEKIISGKIVEITKKNKEYYELTISITPVILTKIVVHSLQKIKLVN